MMKLATTPQKSKNMKAVNGAFNVKGYSTYEAMNEFIDGNYSIVDGEVSSDFSSNYCVISKELASLNNLSVGDVFVNSILDNYFLATGDEKNGKNVYVAKKDGTIDTKKVQNEAYIVPCISMDKNNLTKGTGTLTDPYRTE